MRIGKPLLATTTILGLGLGIYETYRLVPRLLWLLLPVLGLFGGGLAWIVRKASSEHHSVGDAD